MSKFTRFVALAFGLGMCMLLLAPEARAQIATGNSVIRDATNDDNGKDAKWWQFWKREKEVDEQPVWKGWTPSRKGAGKKSNRPVFESVQGKGKRKAGDSARERRLHPTKSKKSDERSISPGTGKRVHKRYNKNTFSHKPGEVKTKKANKRSGQQMRRLFMLQPEKKQKNNSFSHKNGSFRRD